MKKWNRYDQETRNRLLDQLDGSELEKYEIDKILSDKEFDDFTKKDWDLMEKTGIVNGVGPGYLLRIVGIKFLTGLIFFSVDYRKHDVNYFIGGDESDRKEADDGLLKYSILSIFDLLKKLEFSDSLYKNIFLFIIYTGIGILYFGAMTVGIAFVILAYFAVRAFGGKDSFNFIPLQMDYVK